MFDPSLRVHSFVDSPAAFEQATPPLARTRVFVTLSPVRRLAAVKHPLHEVAASEDGDVFEYFVDATEAMR